MDRYTAKSHNRDLYADGFTLHYSYCLSSFNPDLKVTKATDEKGFTFIADAGRNYGPLYGIFINDAEASKVKDFCYSGIDSGPYVDGLMDPDMNPAIVYTCE